jgi:hypothetical protein
MTSVRGNSSLLAQIQLDQPAGLAQIKSVIQVCGNLARLSKRWVRTPESWEHQHGASGFVLRDLIDHLFKSDEQKAIPAFMYACWFKASDKIAMNHQTLFIHAANGNSLRGTEFGKSIARKSIGRLYDVPADTSFADARHYASTGRLTKRSLDFGVIVTRRRRKQWRHQTRRGSNIFWPSIDVDDFYLTKTVKEGNVLDRTWIIRQLTSGDALAAEGERLDHCVGEYVSCCLKGISSIWTMESRDLLRTRPLLTIEITPSTKTIVQIKGFKNRDPRENELAIIRQWAAREALSLAKWI